VHIGVEVILLVPTPYYWARSGCASRRGGWQL